jgi:hypothetical protein
VSIHLTSQLVIEVPVPALKMSSNVCVSGVSIVSIHLTPQFVIEVPVPALKMSSNVYVCQVYPL